LSVAINPDCPAYRAILPDGATGVVQLVAFDAATSLAVFRLSDFTSAPPKLGQPKLLRPGDPIMAVGNPFNLHGSISYGVVSTPNRYLAQYAYTPYLQTDAMSIPGSAGGPVLNADGEVIGIQAMIFSNGDRDFNGLSFAIPIDQAMQMAADLLGHGRVLRGHLGVTISPLHDVLTITKVNRNGPSSGILQTQDQVLAVDNTPVQSRAQLTTIIRTRRSGSELGLLVKRAGERLDLVIRLGEAPDQGDGDG
jgi:serine protease Do